HKQPVAAPPIIAPVPTPALAFPAGTLNAPAPLPGAGFLSQPTPLPPQAQPQPALTPIASRAMPLAATLVPAIAFQPATARLLPALMTDTPIAPRTMAALDLLVAKISAPMPQLTAPAAPVAMPQAQAAPSLL